MPSWQFLRALGLLAMATNIAWFALVLVGDYQHAPTGGWMLVGLILVMAFCLAFIAGSDLAECWADMPHRSRRAS